MSSKLWVTFNQKYIYCLIVEGYNEKSLAIKKKDDKEYEEKHQKVKIVTNVYYNSNSNDRFLPCRNK